MRSTTMYQVLLLTAILFLSSLIIPIDTKAGPSRDFNPDIWSGKVTPSIGDVNTTFNFTLNYRDGQNNTPTSVLVAVDGFFYNMTSENETLLNISIAEKFYYNHTGSFAPGTHEYFFYAATANGSDRYPPPPNNRTFKVYVSSPNDPELSDPQTHPYRPTTDTGVNFSIKYRDLDGDAPRNVVVEIYDGFNMDTYGMNYSSGNYTNGVSCSLIGLKLDEGNYSYRFHAVNVRNETVYNPPSGHYSLYIAPNVTVDHPPVLYNNSRYPAEPKESEKVYFFVNYKDADNDAPISIWVEIKDYNRSFSKNIDMTKHQNYSYSQGLKYTANISLSNGTYNYRYLAYNKLNASLPNQNTYYFEVGSSSPVLPTLYSPAVSPQNPVENQTINFTVNYKDTSGGKEPHYVKLVLRPSGGPVSKFNLAQTGTSYRTGVKYYKEIALLEGNHTYYFELILGNYSARFPEDHNYTLYVRPGTSQDHAPVLTGGMHSPSSPGEDDNITFTVKYRDIDGDAPTHITLHLGPASAPFNSSKYTMTWTGSSYSTGVTATYILSLKQGSYRYCFVTSNSKHTYIVWYPGNSSYNYFNVTKSSSPPPGNSAPVLSSPAASPMRPAEGQPVNFTIWYKDADGDAPSYIKMSIGKSGFNGTVYSMSVTGTSYANGISAFKVLNLSAGNYSYHFKTASGNHSVRYPASGSYMLYVAKSSGGSSPERKVNTSVSLSSNPSGGMDMDEIEVEEGLTLRIKEYKEGKISILIESDQPKDRVMTFEIDPDLFGDMTDEGITIKLDGEKVSSSSIEDLTNSTGDKALYNLMMKDGKYLLYLYIPDATSNNVEAYMDDGQEEENASYGLLVAFLIIAVVLSCLVASGIWFLAFAQNRKKKEAFYHDFDLDMDDQGNKTVVSGSLDEEEMDWDSFIE